MVDSLNYSPFFRENGMDVGDAREILIRGGGIAVISIKLEKREARAWPD